MISGATAYAALREGESKVEAAWREGYRPSGGIAISRDPVNYALYYFQGMTLAGPDADDA